MNRYDTLLEWASELGAGSWTGWREACDDLEVEPSRSARRMAALGHLEFDWVGGRFAAAPPAAVLTLHSSGCLYLTGSRRRGRREQLQMVDASNKFNIDLRDAVAQERGPETWLVEAEIAEAQRFCDAAGFAFEVDSGRRMLKAQPVATLEACSEEGRPDPRFPRVFFNPRWRVFETNAPPANDGLWWVEEFRRNVAFVRRQGDWFRLPIREYGPYLAYPDESFITYDGSLGVLTVENKAPLPPLVARAATLQSGRLPTADGPSRHAYVNIDDQLAELVQEKLNAYLTWT